jgi:hypothetical protein
MSKLGEVVAGKQELTTVSVCLAPIKQCTRQQVVRNIPYSFICYMIQGTRFRAKDATETLVEVRKTAQQTGGHKHDHLMRTTLTPRAIRCSRRDVPLTCPRKDYPRSHTEI